jgi:HNH endonuclease
MEVDKRFVLIAHKGDRLYPYVTSENNTERSGFAIAEPGKQNRLGQGHFTDSIQEVIQRVVFDGWSVRAKNTGEVEKEREGSFRLNRRAIYGYEISEEFEHLVKLAETKPLFIDSSDLLKESPIDEITYKAIKSRRGQPEFRNLLLQAFDGKCCISRSEVKSVLEAAHILPHTEETNYSVTNGLLLRADIHTLFDLNLIGIDDNGIVYVSNDLQGSEYWQFHGRCISENISEQMSVNLSRRFAKYEINCEHYFE